MTARTYCDICGREIPGDAHPAVLVVTHYTWQHSSATRRAA